MGYVTAKWVRNGLPTPLSDYHGCPLTVCTRAQHRTTDLTVYTPPPPPAPFSPLSLPHPLEESGALQRAVNAPLVVSGHTRSLFVWSAWGGGQH